MRYTRTELLLLLLLLWVSPGFTVHIQPARKLKLQKYKNYVKIVTHY